MIRPLTSDQRDRLLAAYVAGDKVEAIAADFGVSSCTVCRVANQAGYRRQVKRPEDPRGLYATAREYLAHPRPARGLIKALAAARALNYYSLLTRISEERIARARCGRRVIIRTPRAA